jgi:hypothetical protein
MVVQAIGIQVGSYASAARTLLVPGNMQTEFKEIAIFYTSCDGMLGKFAKIMHQQMK